MLLFLALILIFFSIISEIGWVEHLRYNLFSVEWDINLNSVNQSSG